MDTLHDTQNRARLSIHREDNSEQHIHFWNVPDQYLHTDDDITGQMQGDFMAQMLKGKGNVVMLRGAPGTSWAQNRGNAFRKRLAEKFPDIGVVGDQPPRREAQA